MNYPISISRLSLPIASLYGSMLLHVLILAKVYQKRTMSQCPSFYLIQKFDSTFLSLLFLLITLRVKLISEKDIAQPILSFHRT
jgi:hypothetical protein